MSNGFDPYYSWLGISPEEQPANHYRLLAVRNFESNAEVISNASDARMSHVRTFQTGKRSAESQKILNELAVATRVLLDPAQKEAYDKQLKAKLAAEEAKKPVAKAAPIAKPVAVPVAAPTAPKPLAKAVAIAPSLPVDSVSQQPAPVLLKKKPVNPILIGAVLGGCGFLVLLTLGLGAYLFVGGPKKDPTEVAKNDAVTKDSGSPDEGKTADTKKTDPTDVNPSNKSNEKTNPPENTTATKEATTSNGPDSVAKNPPAVVKTSSESPAVTPRREDDLLRYDWLALATSGNFIRENDSWISSVNSDANSSSIVQFPVEPKGDYVIEGTVRRRQNSGSIFFLVPYQGKQFGVCFDSFHQSTGHLTGLHLWKNYTVRDGENTHKVSGQKLPADEDVNLRVIVNRKQVVLMVNQEVVLDYRGGYADLSIDAAHATPNSNRLGVYVNGGTSIQFKRLRYIPGTVVTPDGMVASTNSPPTKNNTPATTTNSGSTSGGQQATLVFNNNAYALLRGNDNLLSPDKPFTVEFWYRQASDVPAPIGLLRCGDLNLYHIEGSGDDKDVRRFGMGASFHSITGNQDYTVDGKWHHVALVSEDDDFTLYVDGKPDFRATREQLKVKSLEPLEFGRSMPTSDRVQHLAGEIRSVQISNTAKYHGGQAFSPPESDGMRLPSGSNWTYFNARLVPGHNTPPPSRTSLADLVSSSPAPSLMPTTNNPSNPSNPTTNAPTDGADRMRPRSDIVFKFNGNSRLTLETSRPLAKVGSSSYIEYWFKIDGAALARSESVPLLRFGDMTGLVTHSPGSSNWYYYTYSDASNGGNALSGFIPTEWHHALFQFDETFYYAFIDGQRCAQNPLSQNQNFTPIELGRGLRRREPISLAGEIRSLRVGFTKKFVNNFPKPDYATYDHGTEVSVDVALKTEDIETTTPTGGAAPRQSLADLVDPLAGKRVNVPRNPPPEKEKVEAAKVVVSNAFGTKIKAATKPEQKNDLGEELLKQAVGETDNAIAYALLMEARQQALGSQSVELLIDVVNEVDRRFAIDKITALARSLHDMNGTKLAPEQREILAIEAAQVARQASKIGKFDLADDLSDIATNSVKTAKNPDLKKAMKSIRDYCLAGKAAAAEATEAEKKLESDPSDASANLSAGRYAAFYLEDFTKGLPYLAKGPESPLTNAAKLESAAKTNEEKLAAANAWVDALAAAKPFEKTALQRHAQQLFETLAGQTMGLTQTAAKDRAQELRKLIDEAELAVNNGLANRPKTSRSNKPVPGLILRVIGGPSDGRFPLPFIAVVRTSSDISNLDIYDYAYQLTNYSPRCFLKGLVVVEKDMDVAINLSYCDCALVELSADRKKTNKPVTTFSARNRSLYEPKVAVKKGTYAIEIQSTSVYPNFQITNAASGDNLLFHTEDMLRDELSIPITLPSGRVVPSTRIDGGR